MLVGLDASDRVALDSCRIDGNVLVDSLTDQHHRLNATAALSLASCDGRRTAGTVAEQVGATTHVEPSGVLADLGPFIEALAAAGLVRVRRRWRTHLLALVLAAAQFFGSGFRSAGPDRDIERRLACRRRFRPTVVGCARGAAHAGTALLVVGVAGTVGSAGAIAAFAPGAPLGAAAAPLAVVLAGLVTIAAHELGHLAGVHLVGGRPLYVGASLTEVAVAHDVGDARLRGVAVCGPVAGALAALVAVPLLCALPPPADGLAPAITVVLACGHLAGFAPWCVDGRHVWGVAR